MLILGCEMMLGESLAQDAGVISQKHVEKDEKV